MFVVDLLKKATRSENSSSISISFSPRSSKSHTVKDSSHSPQSFYIIQKISENRFPVYQVLMKGSREKRTIKFFSRENKEAEKYYLNEARFAALSHHNIIKMISHGDKRDMLYDGESATLSYVVMEYAPYGDFFDITQNYGAYFTDKIIRSYFRQLIEGLEYLHANRVAHLDLKPENLLLGSDFRLKIVNFDSSYLQGDEKFLSKGTKSYRGPEIFDSSDLSNINLQRPFAADIYSAGIILFLLKSRVFPHFEHQVVEGVDLQDLMNNHNGEFWRVHCDIQDKTASFYDQSYRELFNGMTKADPSQRWTIKQIKASKWYNGPVYSHSRLQRRMTEILGFPQMA